MAQKYWDDEQGGEFIMNPTPTHHSLIQSAPLLPALWMPFLPPSRDWDLSEYMDHYDRHAWNPNFSMPDTRALAADLSDDDENELVHVVAADPALSTGIRVSGASAQSNNIFIPTKAYNW